MLVFEHIGLQNFLFYSDIKVKPAVNPISNNMSLVRTAGSWTWTDVKNKERKYAKIFLLDVSTQDMFIVIMEKICLQILKMKMKYEIKNMIERQVITFYWGLFILFFRGWCPAIDIHKYVRLLSITQLLQTCYGSTPLCKEIWRKILLNMVQTILSNIFYIEVTFLKKSIA